MEKEFYDQYYHLLRARSNSVAIDEDPAETQAMIGITHHLLYPKGDYNGLLQFLSYYGKEFLAPPICQDLKQFYDCHLPYPSRIVELGAGHAWLSDYLSWNLGPKSRIEAVKIDKRQWYGINIVADIETQIGLERVRDEVLPNDLVVMSEFLHCVGGHPKIFEALKGNRVLVVEYLSTDPDRQLSYDAQITRLGAQPLGMFEPDRPLIYTKHIEPYQVWFFDSL